MFAALFTYAGGAPVWYAAPALRWQADAKYSGVLYLAASGPAFDAATWSGVQLDAAGDISVTPLANGSLLLRYQIGNSPAVERTITRIAFASPMPVCTAGPRGRATQTNYQDLWWNPSENGWGVNLAHQGSMLFANVYTFDARGRNAWYCASALQLRADGTFAGGLYEATLPQSPAGQWPSIAVRQVGTMSARFTDGEHGSVSFTVDGRGVEKSVQRLVFGARVAWCNAPAN